MFFRNKWICSVAALSIFAFSDTASACSLLKVASLPISMDHNRPLVDGRINGTDVKLLIDTGAFASIVWRKTADALDLPLYTTGIRVVGVGGSINSQATKLKEFSLGENTAKNVNMFVIDGKAGRGDGPSAIIGADLLEKFDIEISYRDNFINFFRPKDCDETNLNYWSADVYTVPMHRKLSSARGGQHIELTVKVNGESLTALLDTGAMYSAISLSAAEKIGVGPNSPNVEPAENVGGIGRKEQRSWIGSFDSFDLGGIMVKNAKLRIIERKTLRQDVILGSDFIQAHRLLVSYSQQQVYLQYLGGPIFNVKIDDKEEDEEIEIEE